MTPGWLEDLEARLEQQLEVFLEANPGQRELLNAAERQAQQLRRRQRLGQLQGQAGQLRRQLLDLATEIRQWQERSQRARSAGALELAERGEAHAGMLMEQGRRHWQELEALGREAARLQQELQPTAPAPAPNGDVDQLERDWAAFENDQDLEQLRRRQGRQG